MKIRIKKMRENAKLPEFKNGNWMDCYISKIGKVDRCTLSLGGEFDFKKDVHWHDVDSKESITYSKDDVLVFKLGFALELPKGKELHLLPRSGTFRKYGLILTNSMGIGDDTFIGDNDEYMAVMYATRSGSVKVGDRLIQIKIENSMPKYEFEEVVTFGDVPSRGGYGTTGR